MAESHAPSGEEDRTVGYNGRLLADVGLASLGNASLYMELLVIEVGPFEPH